MHRIEMYTSARQACFYPGDGGSPFVLGIGECDGSGWGRCCLMIEMIQDGMGGNIKTLAANYLLHGLALGHDGLIVIHATA